MYTETTQCPNCQAIWTAEEIDWQQCDCCGYPINHENEEDNTPDYGDDIYH